MAEQTIDAVRLAMGVAHRRAELAGDNIARASVPGARARQLDFSAAQSLLARVADGEVTAGALEAQIHSLSEQQATDTSTDASVLSLDAQVAEMSAAATDYQSLGEALGRQFALMRLAIGGRG